MSVTSPRSLSLFLCALTMVALAYWVAGPHALAPWRAEFMSDDFNKGTRALKKSGTASPVAPVVGIMDKPSLPVLVQVTFTDLRKNSLRRDDEPGEPGEIIFTRFLAFDAFVAVTLAFALLWWRREHAAAGQLALTLAFFGFALVCFIINGQARLRGGMFAWPSWSRLLSDVAATLAFGLSLVGFERFFSIFPVRLEDWHVIQSVRHRASSTAAADGKSRPPGRTNLLSLARLIPKLITGVLLLGTVASTLPFLCFDLRGRFDTLPDGTPSTWAEKVGERSLLAGVLAGFVALMLIGAFGWLLSASLAAKLRAGREHCTEEERRQADWLFAGGLVVVVMIALFSFGLLALLLFLAWGPGSAWAQAYLGSIMMLFFPAGWAAMLLALGGAVFLSKTFGARPLLKRTLLVAAAGVLMSALLAVVQHLVTSRLMSHSTLTAQQGVSTVFSGSIAVFTLGFFRQRMDRGIDGFLNRFMPASVIADGKRRDATVMFSDLAGYTALSATDEAKALLVAGHFQKAAAEVARKHGGRVVKTIGDAVLWVFATPAEAMRAALALPAAFEAGISTDGLARVPINSGLHHGTVVEAPDGDVYGAAVNLAARLQGAAQNGEIVASSEAMLEVSSGFRFEPMGKLTLKNVPVPVLGFRVLPA